MLTPKQRKNGTNNKRLELTTIELNTYAPDQSKEN
jgi:hypothetical protein